LSCFFMVDGSRPKILDISDTVKPSINTISAKYSVFINFSQAGYLLYRRILVFRRKTEKVPQAGYFFLTNYPISGIIKV
jgi:hypothetical protein